MRRHFWVLLLAFPLAWNFGPVLLEVIRDSGPLGKDILAFVIPESVTTWQGFGFYIQFLIALLLFVLLLKASNLLFSFTLPKGQRYGTTKSLRRFQGIFAEVAIILFFFFLLPLVSLAINGQQDIEIEDTPVAITEPEPKPEWYQDLWSKVKAKTYEVATGAKPEEKKPEKKPDKPSIYWRKLKSSWHVYLAAAFFLYLPTRFYLLPRKSTKRFIFARHDKTLRFFETGRFGLGGSARFAGLIEEWALRYRMPEKGKGGQLYMGRSLYKPTLHVGLEDDRHMLSIGSSRSGKGTSVIIPNLLLWEGSALVIDPKGTNAAVTAKRRQDMGQNVYIVDPFRVLDERPKDFYKTLRKKERDGFNPLAVDAFDINALTIREDIGVIADALVVSEAISHKDPHWDDSARMLLAGFIAELVTRYKNPSLPMIRDLLVLGKDQQIELWASMSSNKHAGDLARDAGSRMRQGFGTDEMRNIVSNANKHSEWLSSPGIKNVLTKSTFTFSELKEKPTTIYLVVPPRFLDVHKRFLRLFVNLALSEMSKGGRSKTKVLMILDEFQQLGKMVEVEKAFRLLAGYNFIVWPFVQDWAGMVELYGNGANSFLSSSRAVQVFSLSDLQSLEFVSKTIGARSMQYVSGMDSLHTTPLRTPDEVSKETSLESGQQYVLRSGKAPIILEKVKYYEGEGRSLTKLWKFVTRWRYPFLGLYAKDPDYQ